VLALVDDARASGRPFVYLGYRVSGCASLRYKAHFRPHELMATRPGLDQPAQWESPG
jgi:arginine-tRNA-protein transferase